MLDIKVELAQDLDQEFTKAELDQEYIKVDQECIKVELDQVFTKADQATIKPVPLELINQPLEPIKLELQEHQEAQALAIKLELLEPTNLAAPIKLEAINPTKLDLQVQALTNLELIEHPLELLEQPVLVELLAQPVQPVQLAAAFLLPIDTRRNEHIDL